MMKSKGLLVALLFPVFLLGGIAVNPVFAQEKKVEKTVQKPAAGEATVKDIEQNDKVRVAEAIFRPGDVSPTEKRPMRVVHCIKGGTLERTYEDGKKENISWKAGETRIIAEQRPYSVKNIGKGTIHLIVVGMK